MEPFIENFIKGNKIRENKNSRSQTYSSTDILLIYHSVVTEQLAIARHPQFNYSFLLCLDWFRKPGPNS